MYSVLKAIAVIFLTANIVLFSDKMTSAALNGLYLWLNTVIPSLFPFMVISSWLSFGTNGRKNPADRLSLRLFGVPSSLMPIFIIGFLSGYPIGARLISNLYADGKITKSTAEHMIAFCNNPGIVFIISAVSSSMLSDRRAAIFFIGICVFSALFTGIVYNFLFPCRDNVKHISSVQKSTSIYAALSSSVKAVAMVGGCIIFFFAATEAIMNVLPISDGLVRGLIAGILEFTGGIGYLSALSYPKKIVYPLISALLCWGGFSVHLQTMALVESSDIDLRKYISCKAFSAAIAYFTAYFTFDMFFASKADAVLAFNVLPSSQSVFAISSLLAMVIYLWQKEKRV